MAARLATAALSQVGNSPRRVQPGISPRVSRCFVQASLQKQIQQRWINKMAECLDRDHLSNFQAGVRIVRRFFMGNRFLQTSLTRLRFGHSMLNAHLFRTRKNDSPLCSYEEGEENNEHFFIQCKNHDTERAVLFRSVQLLLPDVKLSANMLSGGPAFGGSRATYEKVAEAAMTYIIKSNSSF